MAIVGEVPSTPLRRPPAALVEAFRPMVTAHLSDCMNRLCGVVGLRPYHQTGKLVGCAYTVKTRPGGKRGGAAWIAPVWTGISRTSL